MPFRYVETLNRNDKQFVFAEVGNSVYLQFGQLGADSSRLNESILEGSYIGFFQGTERIRDLLVTGDWDINGIPVEEVPSELVLGETYRVKSSQARPGTDAVVRETETTVTVIEDEGVVRITDSFDIEAGIKATFPFDYRVVNKRYTGFQPRFYPGVQEFDENEPLSEDDDRYPDEIAFDPAVPFQREGLFVHYISFIPQVSGTLLFDIELLAEEMEGFRLTDINGNRLVDVNGNVLVGQVAPMFQVTDINGNRLVDVNNNVLVGFV